MMKKAISIFLLVALTVTIFAACSQKETDGTADGTSGTYDDYTSFAGKSIGAQTGEIYVLVAQDILMAGEVPEYPTITDLLESLKMGRTDAVITDSSYIEPLIDSGAYPDFDYIWVPKDVYANESAVVLHTEELRDAFNEWLAGIVADGTMAEMEERWLGVSLPNEEDIPRFTLTGENGVLRVCDTGDYPPFSYFDSNGDYCGMDYELISRFARHMGMKLDVTMMSYAAIAPYVASGKADMSACYLTVTEERGQSMVFSDPIVSTQGVLIVPKAGAEAETATPRDYTAFSGKDIAVITGALTVNTTEKIGGNPVEYNDSASAAEDVRKGRVAGYMGALTAVQVMATQMDGFEVIPVSKDIFAAQVGGISHDQAIIDRFNAFLAVAEADGTLGEMKDRWFSDKLNLDAPIPPIENSGANGVLEVAICSDSIPYVYSGTDGEYSGFSVELALRFGAYEGMRVKFTDMDFGGLIPYIVSKKADIALANMAITEERKKSVLFTEPFFDEQHGILALKQDTAADNISALPYTDIEGKNIGVLTGAFFDRIVKEKLDANPIYYQDDIAALEDVKNGRIDGVMYDYSTALIINNQPGNEVFEIVAIPEELHSGPMGAISANQATIDRFNEFLAVIEADGTLADIKRRWLEENPGSDPPMPDISLTGENGVMTVATTGLTLPFSYTSANGELKGFCVEVATRFAAFEGKTIEFVTMGFDGLIPYVVSGKADIGVNAIAITEERKQSVLFSEPYYYDRVGVMVLKQAVGPKEEASGFAAWLKTGIERNLITDNRWKMVINGLGVTMTIAVLAQIFGTVFGCFICWLLMRKNRFVRWIGNLYCGLIYGTPIVVLLMITYYIIFGNTSISNVLVAVVAFAMITGASIALNLKGAIETVDPVEIEAARSIGFTAFKAFKTITLPQAVRRALPGYTNGFVELVKATAIVGYIAIQDLTRAGDIIRSRTYDPYFPLLFVAIIYLIVTAICVQVFKRIVQKVNKGGAV